MQPTFENVILLSFPICLSNRKLDEKTIKKRPKNILDDGIPSSIHQRNLYLASIFIIVIELIQIPSRLKNFLPGGSTLKWKTFYCKTDETIHRDQEKFEVFGMKFVWSTLLMIRNILFISTFLTTILLSLTYNKSLMANIWWLSNTLS